MNLRKLHIKWKNPDTKKNMVWFVSDLKEHIEIISGDRRQQVIASEGGRWDMNRKRKKGT